MHSWHQQVTQHLYHLLQRDYARRGCRPHFHSYDLHTAAEVHWLREIIIIIIRIIIINFIAPYNNIRQFDLLKSSKYSLLQDYS